MRRHPLFSSAVMDFFYELFFKNELGTQLFDMLNPQNLFNVRMCSKQAKAMVDTYVETHFGLAKRLSKWFVDVAEFRRLQGATSTIIFDSMALAFLDRDEHAHGDLDLAVWRMHASQVLLYPEREGYCYWPTTLGASTWSEALDIIDRKDWDNDIHAPFFQTLSFLRPNNGSRTRVDITIADESPIEWVLNAHSSMCPSHRVRSGN